MKIQFGLFRGKRDNFKQKFVKMRSISERFSKIDICRIIQKGDLLGENKLE